MNWAPKAKAREDLITAHAHGVLSSVVGACEHFCSILKSLKDQGIIMQKSHKLNDYNSFSLCESFPYLTDNVASISVLNLNCIMFWDQPWQRGPGGGVCQNKHTRNKSGQAAASATSVLS